MPGGAVTRMLVELRTETGVPVESPVRLLDPSDGPNRTWAPGWKWVPVTVTSVPPVTGPDVGETFVTVGAGTYWNGRPLLVADSPPGSVTSTVTFCVPVPASETAVSDAPVTADTDAAAVAPNATAVVAPVCVRALPLTCTDVPPFSGPLPGAIFVIAGLATYVNVVVATESVPAAGCSRTSTVTPPGAPAAGDVAVSDVSEAGVTVTGEPPPKPTAGEMSVTPNPLQGAALEELPLRPTAATRIASTPASERPLGDLHPFVAAHIGWRPRSSPPRGGRLRHRAGRRARTCRRPGRRCPRTDPLRRRRGSSGRRPAR